MTTQTTDDAPGTFYHETLGCVRKIMTTRFRLSTVSVRPVDVGVSRLSLPVKITGRNKRGKQLRYFGKIISNSDMLTDRSIQLLKNVYLQLHAKRPLFGIFETTEEMVKDHFERLEALHRIGIPTAKPYGYYFLRGQSWLVVTEYLDAKPISSFREIKPEAVDTVFRYLHRMHSRRVFHGDLKPDNIMVGDTIYILDIGHLHKDVPSRDKLAYDLACLLCCFLEFCPVDDILAVARKYYAPQSLEAAAEYLDLVQMRPDIHFNDEKKKTLLRFISP